MEMFTPRGKRQARTLRDGIAIGDDVFQVGTNGVEEVLEHLGELVCSHHGRDGLPLRIAREQWTVREPAQQRGSKGSCHIVADAFDFSKARIVALELAIVKAHDRQRGNVAKVDYRVGSARILLCIRA